MNANHIVITDLQAITELPQLDTSYLFEIYTRLSRNVVIYDVVFWCQDQLGRNYDFRSGISRQKSDMRQVALFRFTIFQCVGFIYSSYFSFLSVLVQKRFYLLPYIFLVFPSVFFVLVYLHLFLILNFLYFSNSSPLTR